MFNSDVLEVVIGLVFVYWLFSLLCTALTEGITRFLALRSGMLWIGIRNMLEAKSKTTSSGLPQERIDISVKGLYASSTFESLSTSGWIDWIRFWRIPKGTFNKSMPSYVAPGTFALALFDTLLTASQFLFSLGFVSRLDKGVLPKVLIKSFNEKLTQSPIENDVTTVTVEKEGKKWRLVVADKEIADKEYVIERMEENTNQKKHWVLKLYELHGKEILATYPLDKIDDSVEDLDKKKLSGYLLNEFGDQDKKLSASPKVIVEEAGSQWVIEDTREVEYIITKENSRLNLWASENKSKLLASVNVKKGEADQYVTELAGERVPEKLKAKFRDQGKRIGDQVVVTGTESPWKIVETIPVKYRIKNEDNTLNVYAVGQESDESEAEMAEKLRAIRVETSGLNVFADDREKQKWLEGLQKQLQSPSSDSMAFQPKARQTFKSLAEGIDKISSEYLRSQLKPILRTAEEETQNWEDALAKVRIGFETWFDDRMERVTGWYTRNTRLIVFLMAVIVTLLFNIDTLAIADALSADTTLREAVAEMATDAVKQNAQSNQGAQTDAGATGVASDTPISPTVSTSDPVSPTVNTSAPVPPIKGDSVPISQTISFSETLDTLDELGLPIGWVVTDSEPDSDDEKPLWRKFFAPLTQPFVTELVVGTEGDNADIAKARRYRQQWPRDSESRGKKFAGLLFTVVMLSLGAPFWFDVLGKLSNLRAAGKVPKETAANTDSG